jgi:pyridoxamine 5'-phosphate oxidase
VNDKTDPMYAPDFLAETEPFKLIEAWCAEAREKEPRDSNAIVVATIDENGMPNIRTVLIKDQGADGFVFYTNFESAKGRELLASRKAALLYYWKSLSRQIRIRGAVDTVSDETADEYFATRPRDAQLGAWASHQSAPMTSRSEFVGRLEAVRKHYEGAPVPRPPHWSGFRLVPSHVEFWQERPFRLHDRLAFERAGEKWRRSLLYP